jgi:hypothetical protein
MMKRFLFFAFCFFLLGLVPVSAQERDAEGWAVSSLKVNGLRLMGKYSKDQILDALGQPDSITTFTSEGDIYTDYCYPGGDDFCFLEHRLLSFNLKNPGAFSINDQIEVLSSIERVYQLKKMLGPQAGALKKYPFSKKKGLGAICFWLGPKVDAILVIYYDENEVVNHISFDVD